MEKEGKDWVVSYYSMGPSASIQMSNSLLWSYGERARKC